MARFRNPISPLWRTAKSRVLRASASLVFQISFFLSPRWVAENTIRHVRTTLGFDAVQSQPPVSVPVRGTLDMWEWAGSIRFNVLTGRIQPFVKVGYGLSWYRLENVTTSGQPLTASDSDWIRKPSLVPVANLFPNAWHYGLGAEFILIAPDAPLTGVGLSLKVDYSVFHHSLGLSFRDVNQSNLEADPSIQRGVLDVMTVVSF